MISFFRKLWKSKRGNAIVIAAACLPMIVGCAGLASDTIQWTLWKRQLQRAADSAAIAAVYDRQAASGSTSTVFATVSHDVTLNDHTWMSLTTGYPIINYDANCPVTSAAGMTNRVCVTLAVQQRLPFSSLFMTTAPTIIANATAANIDTGTACVEALEPSASTPGITNNGNTTINAPTCILFSNSPASNAASAGGSSSVTAKAIAAVGGISHSNNWHVQQYIPYSPPLSDPFANVTPDPSNMHCTSASATKNTDWAAMKAAGINCFASMSTQPHDTIDVPNDWGPIYINGGGVDLKGTINCTGCTIVLTNSSTATNATIGTFDSNAQASNNITAPTTGPYAGIAIYQDRRATANTNTINGGSGNVIRGAVYFPKSTLQINGTGTVDSSGNALSLCAMWVAKDVALIGNSSIAISSPDDATCAGTGMPHNGTVMVRLVA
jgi:Flp pilus assembly protein TadG